MANILIGYNNRALDATMTSNGSWDGTLVLNNIKSERLALVARTSSASRNNTTFVAKFAANYALRAIALLNHNVSTAGRWRARVSAATLDLDYTGTNPRNPGTVTYGGGANGTYVDYLGTVTSGSCPRFDYSPVNLASGAATQTVSSVPAGRYVLSCSGSGSVTATGSTVDNSGTVGMQSVVTFVDVTATGDVTLTVAGTVTAINFRQSLGLLHEEQRTNLLTYSAQFDAAAWNRASETGGSVSAGSSTSPDGGTNADTYTVYAPVGCSACHKGFRGRTGLFQVMPVSTALQALILQDASSLELSRQARQEGLSSLREAGLRKVLAGVTSLDEVLAATRSEA